MSANLAAGCEVVDRPVVRTGSERCHDLLVLLRGPSGGRERRHGAEDIGRIAGVEHERLGEDGDVVPEDHGDLVRVAGAPEVAEQRYPVRGACAPPRRTPPPSQIASARRHDRSCDSSGWPNAESCASANVATSSPSRRGGSEMGVLPIRGGWRLYNGCARGEGFVFGPGTSDLRRRSCPYGPPRLGTNHIVIARVDRVEHDSRGDVIPEGGEPMAMKRVARIDRGWER